MIKDEITIIDKYYIIDYNIDINELDESFGKKILLQRKLTRYMLAFKI